MVTSLRSKWAVGKARGGSISQSIRNRRATQPPAHFQRNPPGRGRLAVFPRCSLDPYESRYGRFTASPARTVLKNSQLTSGDITIICETVHWRNPMDAPGRKGFTFAWAGKDLMRFMRHRQLYWLSILCAAGSALLLASCATNEEPATPPTHQMIGTNSPGY